MAVFRVMPSVFSSCEIESDAYCAPLSSLLPTTAPLARAITALCSPSIVRRFLQFA